MTCKKIVIIDIQHRIRHDSHLLLRNVEFSVCEEDSELCLLGRPLLKTLGINTEEVLEAARERHRGVVDVQSWINDPSTHDIEDENIYSARRDEGLLHMSRKHRSYCNNNRFGTRELSICGFNGA